MTRPTTALLLPALLLAALLASGCGEAAVTATSDVPHPYDGPLTAARDDEARDPARRGGAAALALECDGEVYAGGGGDYVDGGLESVQDSPEEALANYVAEEEGTYPGPAEGFAVEVRTEDRVLLSYDVGDRTKVAAVAADEIRDWQGDTGWGIESWAQCDPAELPAGVAEELGENVWTDADGNRVPVTTVTDFPGPEHCDWQDLTFLTVEGQHFLGGPADDYLVTHYLDGRWDPDTELPAHPEVIVDTGYQRQGRRLWLAADGSAAYVGETPDHVERWPAMEKPLACA